MFKANTPKMKQSCKSSQIEPDDSDDEVERIRNAIASVAQATQVDHRFILAIIMQESGGCVRVASTLSPGSGVPNPGLMQDHDGSFNCVGINDCPQDKVRYPSYLGRLLTR